jgi:hypothetical protein
MKRGAIIRFCVLVACSIGWMLLASSTVFAGTYQVNACNYAPEGANHSWTWSRTDPSQPDHYAEHTNCPDRSGSNGGTSDQEGGLSTTDALGLSSGAPPETSAGWSFTAPPATTITGIEYERYIGHIYDSNNYWAPALRADGTPITGESCLDTIQNGESCFVGGPPGEGGEPGLITGLSAHELALSIRCEAPTGQECITGSTRYKAWAAMYGAKVTLSDTTPPTLTTPTGTLWEPGTDNGFHKGTENVTVSAEDIGGGVQSIVLSADGHPLQTYNAPCNFTYTQPCPLSTGPQTFTLPTTNLTDGTHTLTLAAIDTAGNQSPLATEQITIANNPPPPPTELAATPTQPGGSTFTTTWADPAGQVTPITEATYQVCGSSGCSAPVAAPPGGPATVTVPGPGNWSIAVWLTNAANNSNPSNAAHVNISVPAPNSGGPSPGAPSTGGSRSGAPGSSGPGSSGSGSSANTGSAAPKAKLHLSESLHGRNLIVHVSGPANGHVRVNFTGQLADRTVASGTKTVVLEHGKLTVTFRLGPHTAAHATIRVTATLDHYPKATSTLNRHAPA